MLWGIPIGDNIGFVKFAVCVSNVKSSLYCEIESVTMNITLRYLKIPMSVAIVMLATLAMTPTVFAQQVDEASAEKSQQEEYESKYQKLSVDISFLTIELERKGRVLSDGDDQSIRADREKLLEMQNDQNQLLEKLIELNPENDEYRFRMAKLASAKGDRTRALSILNELAPEDTPGYPMAHFVLAKRHFEKKAMSRMLRLGDLDLALKHIDHVLTRNENDLAGKLLKARILSELQDYQGAYELYADLFDVNPNYYREMAALNRMLEREDRNTALYEKAHASFQVLAADEENQADDKRWLVIEVGIAKTLQKLERFEEAELRLEKLIATYADDPKGGPRRIFLQRLAASNYINWADHVAASNVSFDSLPTETLSMLTALYTKAYSNHQDNDLVLQGLTRLSVSPNAEIAAMAKAVYDPQADTNAPAAVLNQLGNHSLLNKDFSGAIRHYERAREKSPDDPAVLNNLAFSYLVGPQDERNAARALQLINAAIRNLPKDIDPVELSKFLHTKATALKQLERLQEAIAIYEKSLKERRDHPDTLRSLIECYRGLNMVAPEQYISRLKKIEEQSPQKE